MGAGPGKATVSAKDERYPRTCPVCRSAMVGERLTPTALRFSRHVCLSCGTVIEEPSGPDGRPEDDG